MTRSQRTSDAGTIEILLTACAACIHEHRSSTAFLYTPPRCCYFLFAYCREGKRGHTDVALELLYEKPPSKARITFTRRRCVSAVRLNGPMLKLHACAGCAIMPYTASGSLAIIFLNRHSSKLLFGRCEPSHMVWSERFHFFYKKTKPKDDSQRRFLSNLHTGVSDSNVCMCPVLSVDHLLCC